MDNLWNAYIHAWSCLKEKIVSRDGKIYIIQVDKLTFYQRKITLAWNRTSITSGEKPLPTWRVSTPRVGYCSCLAAQTVEPAVSWQDGTSRWHASSLRLPAIARGSSILFGWHRMKIRRPWCCQESRACPCEERRSLQSLPEDGRGIKIDVSEL